MSSSATIPAIRGSVTINSSVDDAFKVFTESFGSWWPAAYHIGKTDMVDAFIEPREGGRWYETCADGTECDWGRVLLWAPPTRLVITWQINGMWQFDPDPEHASEVDVRFTAEGPELTRVDVEHRHFERLVAAQGVHDGMRNGGGWKALLEAYAALANKK